MKGKTIKFPEKTVVAEKRRAAAAKASEKKAPAKPKQQMQRPDIPLGPTPEPQQQAGGGIEQLLQNMA
jgi:hypothetical protein